MHFTIKYSLIFCISFVISNRKSILVFAFLILSSVKTEIAVCRRKPKCGCLRVCRGRYCGWLSIGHSDLFGLRRCRYEAAIRPRDRSLDPQVASLAQTVNSRAALARFRHSGHGDDRCFDRCALSPSDPGKRRNLPPYLCEYALENQS